MWTRLGNARALARTGAVVLLWVGSVPACGNGDTDSDVITPDQLGTGTGATGTGAPVGTGTGTTDPGLEECIWVGTWLAEEALCGGLPYEDFFVFYQEMRLDITHGHDGGCDVTATWSNVQCLEAETWFVNPARGDTSVTIEGKGISECTPDLCKFVPADASCELLDRVRDTVVLVDQKLDIGRLNFTHLASYAAPSCEDEFRLQFTRQ